MQNEEKENNINNNDELFTDEFFSEINNLKKLNEKKSKIDLINNYLKENISNNLGKAFFAKFLKFSFDLMIFLLLFILINVSINFN